MEQMGYYLESSKTKPILLEFTSPGCTICETLAPDIEEFEKEIAEKWNFIKIDASKNMQLVIDFDIYGSPTFIIIKDGNVLNKFKGNSFDKVKEVIRSIK
jgi:thioredoxin 1